jgi:hypothetical protein
MSREPLGIYLEALREVGCEPKLSGGVWHAKCPAHEDSTPSLSLKPGDDGRVLLKCFSGCSFPEITRALGLRKCDAFPSRRERDRGPGRRSPSPRPETAQTTPSPDRPAVDWAAVAARFEAAASEAIVAELADTLGVPAAALRALGVGYATRDELGPFTAGGRARGDAWTFPMSTASGEVVGVNTRPRDGGTKWTLRGGALGLFVPRDLGERDDPVLLVEGASDTAALLGLGYAAVGRPSAKVGDKLAREIARLTEGRRVVVMGENDEKPGRRRNRWPGREGADDLARKLSKMRGEPVRVAMPPAGCKDARDWARAQTPAQENPDGTQPAACPVPSREASDRPSGDRGPDCPF